MTQADARIKAKMAAMTRAAGTAADVAIQKDKADDDHKRKGGR
jgi:hypothetical protein